MQSMLNRVINPFFRPQISDDGVQYASDKRRMLAGIIDSIILIILLMPIDFFFEKFVFQGQNITHIIEGYTSTQSPIYENNIIDLMSLINYMIEQGFIAKVLVSYFSVLMVLSVYLLYFWTKYGATPGKLITKCVIVKRETLVTITFKDALLRLFGYCVSTLCLCIGFLMIGFTKKNRGLHDIIAGTVVIIKQENKNGF